MINHCILSGRITSDLTVRFTRENTPMTDFTMAIWLNQQPVGSITVICKQPLTTLAMAAAKCLRIGDYVVIEGFLWREKIDCDDGTWTDDLYLMASKLLKCEALNLE